MAHESSLRVRFSELDPYDHVNHAAYLVYLETARIEALESEGVDLGSLAREGALIVVADLCIRFLEPATAGDRLVIRTRVEEVRKASSRWAQEVLRDGERLAAARLTGVITDLEGRPRRMPERMAKALEALR